jgi:hypothetical protein
MIDLFLPFYSYDWPLSTLLQLYLIGPLLNCLRCIWPSPSYLAASVFDRPPPTLLKVYLTAPLLPCCRCIWPSCYWSAAGPDSPAREEVLHTLSLQNLNIGYDPTSAWKKWGKFFHTCQDFGCKVIYEERFSYSRKYVTVSSYMRKLMITCGVTPNLF